MLNIFAGKPVRLLAAGLLAISLSGCVEVKTKATVERDGAVSFVTEYDFTKMADMMKSLGGSNQNAPKEMNCAEVGKDKPENVSCKDVSPNKVEFSGKLSKDQAKGVTVDGSKYKVDAVALFSEIASMGKGSGTNAPKSLPNGAEAQQMKSMGMVFDMELNMPGSVKMVDGKSPAESGPVKIDMLSLPAGQTTYMVESSAFPWLWVAVGAGVVVILGGFVFMRRRSA